MKKIWTCTGFVGYWPVGTAAIMVAETKEKAVRLLEMALDNKMLGQKIDPKNVIEIDLDIENAIILADGEY